MELVKGDDISGRSLPPPLILIVAKDISTREPEVVPIHLIGDMSIGK